MGFILLSMPVTAAATASCQRFPLVLALGSTLLLALSVGVWRVTTPNPAMADTERWYAARRQVRYGLVVMCLVGLVNPLAPAAVVPPAAPLFGQALAGPLGLVGLITFHRLASYAPDLARRRGDRRVAAHAARVQGLLAFTWGGMVLLLSLFFMGGAFTRPTPEAPPVTCGLFALGDRISTVLVLALPAQLVEPFHRCRAAAEANWSAALAASTDVDGAGSRADAASEEPGEPAGSSYPAPDDAATRPQ